jgi:hypothetical protein
MSAFRHKAKKDSNGQSTRDEKNARQTHREAFRPGLALALALG